MRQVGKTATRRGLGALLLLAAVGMIGAPQALAAKVIKIGVLAPMTGGASADGEEMVRGAKLAAKEINKAGGVKGYTFEMVR